MDKNNENQIVSLLRYISIVDENYVNSTYHWIVWMGKKKDSYKALYEYLLKELQIDTSTENGKEEAKFWKKEIDDSFKESEFLDLSNEEERGFIKIIYPGDMITSSTSTFFNK